MKDSTKAVLAALKRESTELVILQDDTLTADDIVHIGREITACPYLTSVAIKDCGLTYKQLKPLVPVLAEHPSLLKLDFSKNRFSNVRQMGDFFLPILEKAPRINEIECVVYKSVLHPIMPSFGKDGVHKSLSKKHKVMYFKCGWNELHKTQYSAEWIFHGACSDRDSHANTASNYSQFLSDITAGHVTGVYSNKLHASANERAEICRRVEQIPQYIKEIIYFSENGRHNTKLFRSYITQLLVQIKRDTPAEYANRINVEDYMTLAEKEKHGIVAKAEVQATATTPLVLPSGRLMRDHGSLADMYANAPQRVATTGEDIVPEPQGLMTAQRVREYLAKAKDSPAQILRFGREASAQLSVIANADLHVSVSGTSAAISTQSLANFLQLFREAQDELTQWNVAHQESLKTKPKEHPLLQAIRDVAIGLVERVTGKSYSESEQLRLLASVTRKAEEAGVTLQTLSPNFATMHEGTALKVDHAQKIITAYSQVGQYLCMLQEVGREVLAEWTVGQSPTVDVALAGQSFLASTTPIHIANLDERMVVIVNLITQARNNIHNVQGRADLVDAQREALALVCEQTLPAIVSCVADFIGNVQAIGQAEQIRSMAGLAAAAQHDNGLVHFQAAMATANACAQLATSSMHAIGNSGNVTRSQIADAAAQAFRSDSLTITPQPTAATQVGRKVQRSTPMSTPS